MMKLGAKFGMVCMAIFAVTAPVRVVAHEHHGYGAGEAGDSRRPARVVEIVMSDADGKMSYAPDHLEFSRGEQVKFVIRNQGALSHEFVLGSRSENHEHAVMMAAMPDRFKHLEGTLEPTEYTGHLAWAMFNDPEMMRFNGKTVIGAEVGKDYGITDDAGKFPPSPRLGTGASPPQYAAYKVK